MDIHMQQHHGDGDYWSLAFISQGVEFTEADLTAVRYAVELPGSVHGSGRQLLPLDQHDRPGGGPSRSYRGGWDRADGLRRTNRIVVSCTKGQRPGPTAWAYHALRQQYPGARFVMIDHYLREQLTKGGLDIVNS